MFAIGKISSLVTEKFELHQIKFYDIQRRSQISASVEVDNSFS